MAQKKTKDALEIIHQDMGDDRETRQMIEDEKLNIKVAQMIFDARTSAGLTPQQLVDLVGASQPNIARLEGADYEGLSLSMLQRIAAALYRHLVVRMVPEERQPTG